MKLAAGFFSLLGLIACSFPKYQTDGENVGTAGGGGTATVVPTCDDGKRNGDETGIDCGMAACSTVCPVGQGCSGDADCDGGKCQDKICRAIACNDGLRNGDETDIDCGGSQGCHRCTTDQHCTSTSDCDGGLCTSGQCRAPSCKDGLQNANETDVDCGGGTCLPCAIGKACTKTEDCDGVACSRSVCQPASCTDSLQNEDETDVDCGGGCPTACDDGQRCKVAADCSSGVCPKKTLVCAVPSCSDGVLNGSEPSLDCGASCPSKCKELDACSAPADCESNACTSNTCVPASATGQLLSTVGWVATASETFGASTTSDLIDGNSGTDWTSGAVRYAGMWIMVDMHQRQAFFRIELESLKATDVAASVNVWISDDGTFKNEVKKNVAGGTLTTIDFQSALVARYIKIEVAQGGSDWWRVNEIRVKQ